MLKLTYDLYVFCYPTIVASNLHQADPTPSFMYYNNNTVSAQSTNPPSPFPNSVPSSGLMTPRSYHCSYCPLFSFFSIDLPPSPPTSLLITCFPPLGPASNPFPRHFFSGRTQMLIVTPRPIGRNQTTPYRCTASKVEILTIIRAISR